MKLIILPLAIILVIWAAGFAAITWAHLRLSASASQTPEPADAIICLGAGMASPTSEAPGPSSRRRAETCAALYRAGVAPLIIFTGAGNDVRSAARAMADTARAAGVPPEAMVVEPRSMSTIQNAAFSLPLLPATATHLLVVSDGFHLPRAWIIFRALGAQETRLHATSDLPRLQAFRWIGRESIAIWFNLWRASLYVGGGILGIDAERRISWFN